MGNENILEIPECNHIPIFLTEMYREGRIERKGLGKEYQKHLEKCDFCKNTLEQYDRELKGEFTRR